MSKLIKSNDDTKTTDFNLVDFNRLTFTELKDGKYQRNAYPRYNDPELGSNSDLNIQLPFIPVVFGFPNLDSENFTDDLKRGQLKLILDQTNPEIVKLTDKLRNDFDNKFNTNKFRETVFGDKAAKYGNGWTHFIKEPSEDDSNSKNKKKSQYPKYPTMKIKLDFDYHNDNKIQTKVFKSEIGSDGKRVRTIIEGIETVDDISKYICSGTKIRAIIAPIKLWAQLTNKPNPMYGIGFKMIKVEVESGSNNKKKNIEEYRNADNFIDDDVVIPTSTKAVKQDSESDSDSENEMPKKIEVKEKTIVNVESDDSEDEKPKKAVVKEKKVIEIVESDDSEDEKPKKPVAKGKKVVEVESSDSEDEKPKKPITKGKKK